MTPRFVVTLDMVQTLGLAAVVLFAGYGIRRVVGILDRYNIPAPVVGGFLFAAVSLALRQAGLVGFEFTTTLQAPLMIAFFTTIGLGASLGLLRVGGPQVLLFFALASFVAILQNGVGVALARALGVEPMLGLLAGSITMTGGHGTGAAFGQLLEDSYGFTGAVTLAMAAATFGLVSGGIIGGPVATRLVTRLKLRGRPAPVSSAAADGVPVLHEPGRELHTKPPDAYRLLQVITIVLIAMSVGGWLGTLVQERGVTLPAYIGAMIVAAILRNGADATGLVRIDQRIVDDLGMIALSLFLSMALMTLRLWELLDLAVPLFVILLAQVAMMVAFAYFVTFRVMGRDYDAAVMAAGHCGFSLGATPNAVANMEAITERFGPAPRALLVVTMVGAFFIDFTNALIITTFINWVT